MVGGPTHTGREKYKSGKGVVYLMKAKRSILRGSREDAAGERERLQKSSLIFSLSFHLSLWASPADGYHM